MHARLHLLRLALAENGFDSFVSLSPAANQYLTGFEGSSSGVVVTSESALFLCDFRYIEQASEAVQAYEVREVPGMIEARLGECLRELDVSRPAFDPSVTTVLQASGVRQAFGGELYESRGLLSTLRQHKTEEEIRRIRAASELAEDAMLALRGELQEGISEREWAARLEYEFKRRGASDVSFSPIVLFGERSSLPHGKPSGRCLAKGDIVLIDCGCILDGYCSDLTRTYAYGRIPGPWFEDIYETVLTAQAVGLAELGAGISCAQADAAARQIIADAGYSQFFGHGLGHGVGIEVHEAPRLNKESVAVLEPGMVVTVEPGIYLPGQGGVRIEDLVVVTERGCDLLTRASKRLEVL